MVYRDDLQEGYHDDPVQEEEEACVDASTEGTLTGGFSPLFITDSLSDDSEDLPRRRRKRTDSQTVRICFVILFLLAIVVAYGHLFHGESVDQGGHPSLPNDDLDDPLTHNDMDGKKVIPPAKNKPIFMPPACKRFNELNYTSLVQNVSDHPSWRCGDSTTSTNKPCHCNDPLHGSKTQQSWIKAWERTFKRNKELLLPFQDHGLDLLMLGDSIVEHWVGTDQAVLVAGKISAKYAGINQVYKKLFQSKELTGLALGIGGDRCSQLLYRVQNGELPISLSVPIVWINIGTNDLPDRCSEDVIVAGIVSVAREVASRPLVHKVVINSILPRGGNKNEDPIRISKDVFWLLASRVNSRIECFALHEPNIEYFDATDIFLSNHDPEYRNKALYMDSVHPSKEGYALWGKAILKRVYEIQAELSEIGIPLDGSVPRATEPTTSPTGMLPLDPFLEACPDLRFNYTPSFPTSSSLCDARPPCKCYDPYLPTVRRFDGDQDKGKWERAFNRNVETLVPYLPAKSIPSPVTRPLDVLMVGDSLVEHLQGTQYADPSPTIAGETTLSACNNIYNDLFRSNHSSVRGLALGISGDRAPNLQWRLQHGELPKELDAPVIWLMVGTNDIGLDHCNVASTTAGIVRIVKAIMSRPLVKRLVVSSLFPRGGDSRYWEIHRRVNQQLECFINSHGDTVEFFNATDLFWSSSGRNVSLFHDEVHPSPEGYRVLGNAIRQRVLDIKKDFG